MTRAFVTDSNTHFTDWPWTVLRVSPSMSEHRIWVPFPTVSSRATVSMSVQQDLEIHFPELLCGVSKAMPREGTLQAEPTSHCLCQFLL